jgi:hypothetical protein
MPQKVRKMTYVTVILYHLTGERAFRGSADSPAGFLKLTTTGRTSGQPRTVHLLYIRDGSAYVVTASNGGSGALLAGSSMCAATKRSACRRRTGK